MGDNEEKNQKFLKETAKLIAKIDELQADIAEHRKNEQRFRDIAENTPGWIWEVDTEGVFTYVSPVVKEFWEEGKVKIVLAKYILETGEVKVQE